MALSPAWWRSRLIPVALVALAAALTVPWTFWVIKAAYDRHIEQNARAVARRVELRISLVQSGPSAAQRVREALNTELDTDDTVQLASFCDVSNWPAYTMIGYIKRNSGGTPPKWGPDEIRRRAVSGVRREEAGGRVDITVPWERGNKALGFTYLEFSRDSLNADFWAKEGPLMRRVIGLTVAAIAFLSALGIVAYRAAMKVGHVEKQAELARQGMMAERGLTAAVLAHEIRNPLAALRFQLHSLRRNAAEPERVGRTADTIDAELLRIQQLVSDYLEHERARGLRVGRVDLAEAARTLQTLMGDLLRASNIELMLVTPAEPAVVVCDPHALRQILMNLVLNAQQAMQPPAMQPPAMQPPATAGPATAGRNEGSAVSSRRGWISISVGQTEGFGVIDLADNGPGIPPEMRDRLFKPFQTTRNEGAGLGLALVKRFVDNFGGSVAVDSEMGKGTIVHLKLPLADYSLNGDGASAMTVGVTPALPQGVAPSQ